MKRVSEHFMRNEPPSRLSGYTLGGWSMIASIDVAAALAAVASAAAAAAALADREQRRCFGGMAASWRVPWTG
eukprot:CAMPEP_0198118058 /NCGR_PEP_ID=MMETSP1442-20131203/20222_1 /TAXON_ID= /ORGANISM="Craspedostauros australis, Strain CCMP3328" /LENGTH=72 /DNA_ID=CAMNT_0043776247 /DNA_START=23 /DNA_END=238 /DNA_ORIENTATION=-